jgi:N-acetylglucosamine kinase-like BadF-type ATPase
VLAVDGGGSKIDAALLRRDGTLLGAARVDRSIRRRRESLTTGAPEHDDDGEPHMRQILQAVDAACRDADIATGRHPVADVGAFCLAGADLAADDRRIDRWLRRQDLACQRLIRNDTFAVLRAGTDRTWGVGIVCGFGTNCSAVSPDGRTYRLPAVGVISGDWGGATDLGEAALWYAIRASDGRGRRTAFQRLVPAYFGMKRPRQVMEALYFEQLDTDRLAELAPLVFHAARDGDPTAQSLVDRQADEIATMAGAAIRRLRMTRLDVDVVLGGGIFRNDDAGFFRRIHEGIQAIAPRARITVLTDPPVIGAAQLGLDLVGASRAAHARVRATLTHARLTAHTHGRA